MDLQIEYSLLERRLEGAVLSACRQLGIAVTAYGVLGCVAILLGAPIMWVFMALIPVALVPILYSLVLYKRLEKQGRV